VNLVDLGSRIVGSCLTELAVYCRSADGMSNSNRDRHLISDVMTEIGHSASRLDIESQKYIFVDHDNQNGQRHIFCTACISLSRLVLSLNCTVQQ
jgi:hypothetical protein